MGTSKVYSKNFQDYNVEGGSYQHLAELTILNVQLIHQFTAHLPGFSKLSDEDKRTLHKVSVLEGIFKLSKF